MRDTLFALTLAALLLAPSRTSAQSDYRNPHWYVLLSDAGYSDFLIYTEGAFPADALHEFISGEWGAAVGYDGIPLTAPQRTMWLETTWDYPTWTTNSNFTVLEPGSFPADTDGDGLPEGSAIIGNAEVEITISWDMMDTVTGTPMGLGGGTSVLSDRYVLITTYAIKNLKTTNLTGVRFYPFLHGHPANDERPQVRAVYDTQAHAGALSQYRYDVTQFSTNTGQIDGSPTGCTFEDHIGFSTDIPPADFGLGHFRGHTDRPATGLHLDVENDTLMNQTTFGPDEVAGATRIDLGPIAPQATQSVRVLLSVRSMDQTPGATTATACVRLTPGPDPGLRVDKGPCIGGSTAGPYDVLRGNLDSLVEGGGIVVADGACMADELMQDRVTIQSTLSACSPAVFVLARNGAGTQFDYGTGSGGAVRFAATGCP
jgi:hypothetical protein